MLVFDRENWRYHRTWCVAIVIASILATVLYLLYGFRSGSWNWPGGASPPGFAYGLLGGAIIVFEMLLWPRKSLWRGWRLGRTKVWMTAHLWLGLLTLPLLLLHGGFHFGVSRSALAGVLMWLLVLVVASGSLGLVVQNIVPKLILEKVPAETINSQIRRILDLYHAEAERLVVATCGQGALIDPSAAISRDRAPVTDASPAVVPIGAMRRAGRVQGKSVEVGVAPQYVPGSEPLLGFFREQVEPYLRAKSGTSLPLGSPQRSTVLFEALSSALPKSALPVVDRLADLCDQRRQFDLQARLQGWLTTWLAVHVALSIALFVLMVVHIVLALKYV